MFPAVMDFSFVNSESSEAGIPFATIVGALTVTRCESAARYVCAVATLLMMHGMKDSSNAAYSCKQVKYFSHNHPFTCSVSACSKPQLQSVSPDRQCLWVVYLQQSVQWYSSSLY